MMLASYTIDVVTQIEIWAESGKTPDWIRDTLEWSPHWFDTVCNRHNIVFGERSERGKPQPLDEQPLYFQGPVLRPSGDARESYQIACANYLNACFAGALPLLPALADDVYRAKAGLMRAGDA